MQSAEKCNWCGKVEIVPKDGETGCRWKVIKVKGRKELLCPRCIKFGKRKGCVKDESSN